MIDPLISAINTVIFWIVGGIADIAYFFGMLAYYSLQIPVVGGYLNSHFLSIQGLLNDWALDLIRLAVHVQNVLNAIDDWLDQAAALAGAVYGWISDKLQDAYDWATDAWDWIVDTGQDLWDYVHGWMLDRLQDAYKAARDALNWIVDTGQDLWDYVHGWISDRLDDAYAWAINALDWIQDFPSHLAPFLDALKASILQPIAPFINLVSFFFEDINDFFSDPLGFILSRLTQIAKKYEQMLLDIIDKIGDALFGD